MADTGLGATFSGTTTVGSIRSMTLPELTIEDIETSHLGTTGQKTYVSGDLVEPGELGLEVLFDATSDSLETFGASESVTITFPVHTSGNTQAATLVGTAYVKTQKMPDMNLNELQVYNITFKYDGLTDVAWTAET